MEARAAPSPWTSPTMDVPHCFPVSTTDFGSELVTPLPSLPLPPLPPSPLLLPSGFPPSSPILFLPKHTHHFLSLSLDGLERRGGQEGACQWVRGRFTNQNNVMSPTESKSSKGSKGRGLKQDGDAPEAGGHWQRGHWQGRDLEDGTGER
eukprot:968319-Rhodomonas_salina.2